MGIAIGASAILWTAILFTTFTLTSDPAMQFVTALAYATSMLLSCIGAVLVYCGLRFQARAVKQRSEQSASTC
jgi:hypothetical protein